MQQGNIRLYLAQPSTAGVSLEVKRETLTSPFQRSGDGVLLGWL